MEIVDLKLQTLSENRSRFLKFLKIFSGGMCNICIFAVFMLTPSYVVLYRVKKSKIDEFWTPWGRILRNVAGHTCFPNIFCWLFQMWYREIIAGYKYLHYLEEETPQSHTTHEFFTTLWSILRKVVGNTCFLLLFHKHSRNHTKDGYRLK